MKRHSVLILVALVLSGIAACKKDKTYVYDVNDTTIKQNSSSKKNVKTTTEFVSIAFADLFSTNINNAELNKLSTAYDGFGDKKLIERLIIKNYLNNPSAKVPSKAVMKADVGKFVKDTYKKFYARDPNDFELWTIKNIITSDTSITPTHVYYSIMTSNEYRYY